MRQDFEGRIGPRIASCERGPISVSPETGRFIHSQCPRNRVRYTWCKNKIEYVLETTMDVPLDESKIVQTVMDRLATLCKK